MTVSSTSNKVIYNGAGGSGPFSFSFKVFASGDLDVIQTNAAGVETTLTEVTHYSVALNADQNNNPGGTVSSVSPIPVGEKLTLLRVVDALQETDIQNAGGFYPEVLEDAFDRSIMVSQQLTEAMGRTFRIPVSSDADPTLPAPAPLGVFGWDALGTKIINYILQAGTSLVDLASSIGASLIGFIQAGVGAVLRSVEDKLRESVSVFDFMTAAEIADVQAGTALLDVTAPIQAALTYVESADANLKWPRGSYVITRRLISDAANARHIKISGKGSVKVLWKGGNNDVALDLRRWTNTCELSRIVFENTIQATNVAAIRMTCWTGTGTTLSGTVDMAWLHDLVLGQPGGLGFAKGLQLGDQTAYGTGEYFTYNCFDRIFARHCTYGVYIDATTFDLNQIRAMNGNGGGSASDGSDANATNHIKAITNVDRLLIRGFNSNRCSGHAIDLAGGSVHVNGAWFEQSLGAFKMSASGSARPSVIEYAKFTNTVANASGDAVWYNGFGTLAVRDSEFDACNLFVEAEQTLITSNNEYTNGATIKRTDERFKRTYNIRPLGQAAPHWERIELTFANFTAASGTIVFDIPVANEPTSTIIHDIVVRAETGFTGGAVSAATLAFGISTDATGFFASANVFATGPFRITSESEKGTLLWDSGNTYPKKYVMTAAKTLRATLTLTGGNGSDLTAGQCHVYLLTSALYAAESYYPEIFN